MVLAELGRLPGSRSARVLMHIDFPSFRFEPFLAKYGNPLASRLSRQGCDQFCHGKVDLLNITCLQLTHHMNVDESAMVKVIIWVCGSS